MRVSFWVCSFIQACLIIGAALVEPKTKPNDENRFRSLSFIWRIVVSLVCRTVPHCNKFGCKCLNAQNLTYYRDQDNFFSLFSSLYERNALLYLDICVSGEKSDRWRERWGKKVNKMSDQRLHAAIHSDLKLERVSEKCKTNHFMSLFSISIQLSCQHVMTECSLNLKYFDMHFHNLWKFHTINVMKSRLIWSQFVNGAKNGIRSKCLDGYLALMVVQSARVCAMHFLATPTNFFDCLHWPCIEKSDYKWGNQATEQTNAPFTYIFSSSLSLSLIRFQLCWNVTCQRRICAYHADVVFVQSKFEQKTATRSKRITFWL